MTRIDRGRDVGPLRGSQGPEAAGKAFGKRVAKGEKPARSAATAPGVAIKRKKVAEGTTRLGANFRAGVGGGKRRKGREPFAKKGKAPQKTATRRRKDKDEADEERA